jgi:pSer/pThr/pTyr-binding forkhead associated (FHA) protein
VAINPGAYTVGRDPSCNILITRDEPEWGSVSRRHAVIRVLDNGDILVLDTGSKNGTSLNGERIDYHAKALPSDLLKLGEVEHEVGWFLQQLNNEIEIFVSYARADKDRALIIAHFLKNCGWSVWYDVELPVARAFDETLEEKIKEARVVLVVWSKTSINSQWVRAEASFGLEKGCLVQVLIDDILPPLLFRQIQGTKITQWDTSELDCELASLRDKLWPLVPSIPKPTTVA